MKNETTGYAPLFPGRWVTTRESRNGWQILLIENDHFRDVLHELPYGSRVLAHRHARKWADLYGIQMVPECYQ